MAAERSYAAGEQLQSSTSSGRGNIVVDVGNEDFSRHVLGVDWGSGLDWAMTGMLLDKVKFRASNFVTNHEFERRRDHEAVFRLVLENLDQAIECQLTAWVVSTLPETRTFRWPADWWEAVKERWAPAWCLDRWPVRYTVKTLEHRLIFPEAPPPSVLGKSARWVTERTHTEVIR